MGGNNLRRVLDGAFAGSVVFLPRALEGTTDPDTARSDWFSSPLAWDDDDFSAEESRDHGSPGLIVLLLLTVVAMALVAYYQRKQHRWWTWSSTTVAPTATGFRTPYVELPTIEQHNN